MLIRFVVKNLFSFKEETEFNLFPNKTQRLNHHKFSHQGVDFLRLSAIYGANGSGKSNLIKSISLLEEMVETGKVDSITNMDDLKFKLDDDNLKQPISLAIEFLMKEKFYYYSITFDKGIILNEELYQSKLNEDLLIFSRNNIDNNQTVDFYEGYIDNEKNKLFVDVLAEKLIQKDQVLLTFLMEKYGYEFPDVVNAYDWFDIKLAIIRPNARPGGLAHIFDKSKGLFRFANEMMPVLSTGISRLVVQKRKFTEFIKDEDLNQANEIVNELKDNPNSVSVLKHSDTGEEVSVVYEQGGTVMKQLVPIHPNKVGAEFDSKLAMESDGTQRLIEYLPAFDGIINEDRVFLIDEIERSIHPITIKEIIAKISLDKNAKGQLIFTTHESCLLDQDILRPDEIWFAQKDTYGASRIYPLSDFNIHHTANIENCYLDGRYGGIPSLTNMHDLNWHQNDVSE